MIGWICLIAFNPNITPVVNQGLILGHTIPFTGYHSHFCLCILIITIIIHPLA